MKQTSSLLAVLLLAALPAYAGPAPAPAPVAPPPPVESTFSYSFLEAGWSHLDFDAFDDTDGYYVHAQYSPMESVFIYGRWGQDFGSVDRDLIDMGLGVYIPVVSRVHWVTTAGAGYVQADAGAFDDEAWSFKASTGLRIRMCPKSELEVAYNFATDDIDEQHSASAAILYNVTSQVQLVARGFFSDDENGFGAGIRYNF
jgi:hypothetical protein